MTMQDNGISPNERTSLNFQYSKFRHGELYGTRQKELSKGWTEAAKTAERAVCDGKKRRIASVAARRGCQEG